jgi:nucleotide-binding universal stress UspA family protein
VRKAVIAVEPIVPSTDPVPKRPKSFDSYVRQIRLFQQKGIIPRSTIASMIYSSLYLVPLSWYSENKNRYAKEAKRDLEELCAGLFEFDQIKVLKADSSSQSYLAEKLSKYVKRIQSDLLVVLSSNREGLPYWVLGSFSETLALTADQPIMVLKSHTRESDFSTKVRILVALDVAASYSAQEIGWLIKLAKNSNAHVDLVYAKPRRAKFLDSVRLPKEQKEAESKMAAISSVFRKAGVTVTIAVLSESDSVAKAIVEYADKRQSWVLVTISTQRQWFRRLLLGSTARKILSLTKRPFLSLRLTRD